MELNQFSLVNQIMTSLMVLLEFLINKEKSMKVQCKAIVKMDGVDLSQMIQFRLVIGTTVNLWVVKKILYVLFSGHHLILKVKDNWFN